MACCGDASGWSKIGLICCIAALGSQAAGYFTNSWMNWTTVKDSVDVRVGLWWFTNCSTGITCFTVPTPSSYKSLMFTITQGLEGGVAGLLLIASIMYSFYVMAERSRTKAVAGAIMTFLVIAACCSIGALALWILQIDHPYFLAWSAGLSVIATVLALIATLCLVPDIKEYPYERLQITPAAEKSKHRREKQTFYTKHGKDKKKSSVIGRDQPYRDPYVRKSGGDLGHDYGRYDDPYVKNRSYLEDESDRFSLNVVTPSRPPRGDFFVNKPRY